MTRAWPVEEPSATFADRTVAAVIRDRGARRVRAKRLTFATVLVAAALGTGGAWAWTGARAIFTATVSEPAPAPAVDGARDVAPVVRRDLHGGRAVRELEAPQPPTPPSAFVPLVEDVPAGPAVSPAPAVIVPRCRCADWTCDCVEVPWLADPRDRSMEKGNVTCEGIELSSGCLRAPFSR